MTLSQIERRVNNERNYYIFIRHTCSYCCHDLLLHEDEGELITIGASSGPFADMASFALKPVLEEQGYTVEIVEYSDYIQPNNALANGDLDANLFQNVCSWMVIMKKMAQI